MQDTPPSASAYTSVESPWEQAPSVAQFPPDVFLDIHTFECLNQVLPRPVIDIPAEVLNLIGDGATVQHTVNAYFATIYPSPRSAYK
ncbi:hypothetical protein CTA2_8029 [Colletotrichum tanaceti]|nr:hypothetical protein CTA2_8029 [Colletotrichum tanaceti]